jgi:hypothetical protein
MALQIQPKTFLARPKIGVWCLYFEPPIGDALCASISVLQPEMLLVPPFGASKWRCSCDDYEMVHLIT